MAGPAAIRRLSSASSRAAHPGDTDSRVPAPRFRVAYFVAPPVRGAEPRKKRSRLLEKTSPWPASSPLKMTGIEPGSPGHSEITSTAGYDLNRVWVLREAHRGSPETM